MRNSARLPIGLALAAMLNVTSVSDANAIEPSVKLVPQEVRELSGFDGEDFLDVWKSFERTCSSIANGARELRTGVPPSIDLASVCRRAIAHAPVDLPGAKSFFIESFQPFLIVPPNMESSALPAFFTAYFEPVVDGSLYPTAEYTEPLYQRPDDLVTLNPAQNYPNLPRGLAVARQNPDGTLEPFPDRAAIDAGAIKDRTKPVAWVRDAIEAFMIHVQGSAAIRLNSGEIARLTYAGRNGHPYTSIGKALVELDRLPAEQMSMDGIKQWVRSNGQATGEKGRLLLHRNASYIFFRLDKTAGRQEGPIGAAGVPLTPWRSIAVDRNVWPYGLPFWIEADIPWRTDTATQFRRLMIAQDTGSAIIGSARADLYFGSGDRAGLMAGAIRHNGRMTVFLPKAQVEYVSP